MTPSHPPSTKIQQQGSDTPCNMDFHTSTWDDGDVEVEWSGQSRSEDFGSQDDADGSLSLSEDCNSTGVSNQALDLTIEIGCFERAEGEIASDFERIVKSIKESTNLNDTGGVGGPLPWNFSIEEGEVGNKDLDDGEDQIKIDRSKKKRKRRGDVELSHQVKALIGEAAAAFIDRDIPKTIELCQEVIRIEPAAYAAWNTLSLVHEELNEPDIALKMKIMAAHLQGDAELWGELGRASREAHKMQQALYCFRKAVSLNPRDVDALWDRSVMLRETGENRAAMNGFMTILKIVPHHLGVLQQLGPLLSTLSEFHKGISIFQDALTFYQQSMTQGPTELETGECLVLIVTLADFCNTVGEHEQAIEVVRNGARWMQGRAQQKYWSSHTDDSEFDPAGFVRPGSGEDARLQRPTGFDLDPNLRHRLCLARLALGDLDEGQMHGKLVLENEFTEYSTLFHEVAMAYFAYGLYEASLNVFEDLATHEETSTVDIIMHIAACHRHMGNYDRAVEVFEYVLTIDPVNHDAKMRLAEVFEILNHPRKALNLVNEVIASRKLLKEQMKPQASLESEHAANFVLETGDSLFEEKQRAPKRSVISIEKIERLENERQAMVDGAFSKLLHLTDVDGSDRPDWLREAGILTDMFRETRELFGGNRFSQYRGLVNERRLKRLKTATDRERNESDMASRLQLELSDRIHKDVKAKSAEFRGHDFEDWLNLFIQYAFTLTKDGKYSLAVEALKHVAFSNAYADFTSQTTIRVALLACATYEKDHPAVVEHSRKLMFTHQFHNDPMRLMLACLGGGYHAVDAFIDTNLQKALNRDIKFTSMAVEGQECQWVVSRNRWAFGGSKGKNDDDVVDFVDGEGDMELQGEPEDNESPDVGPTSKTKQKYKVANAAVGANPSPALASKESPILLTMYAQLSLCAKSYQSALFYLLHAYEIQPDDEVICLSLAVASLSRAMQRQADNRQHLIAQGLAFLSRYRSLRGAAEHLEEIEYNFGRTFHHLGLLHLAVKHYERVLALVESRLSDASDTSRSDSGLAQEAAYNLVLIYATTGATAVSRTLSQRWLSM